jgi:hypothetical protein
MAKGHMVAFGLVGDPAGPYGVGIVLCDDEDAVRAFTNSDPAIATFCRCRSAWSDRRVPLYVAPSRHVTFEYNPAKL